MVNSKILFEWRQRVDLRGWVEKMARYHKAIPSFPREREPQRCEVEGAGRCAGQGKLPTPVFGAMNNPLDE